MYIGIVYPWTVLDPFYLQSLNSLLKELGKVSTNLFSISSNFWLLPFPPTFYLQGMSWLVTCIFIVAIFTKFDGQIINEYVNLLGVEIEDKWGKARDNAEATFQTVYLPKVLNTQHPPKGYVQLEGEDDNNMFL